MFVNDEFVEGPYEVQQEGDLLFVNGHRIEVSEGSVNFQPESEGRNRRFNGERQRGGAADDGFGNECLLARLVK